MKDSKGGFMVDEDEGRKDESEAILKKRELLQQLKKPFFDPGTSHNGTKLTYSAEFESRRQPKMFRMWEHGTGFPVPQNLRNKSLFQMQRQISGEILSSHENRV